MTGALIIILIFVIGYASQRGRTCAVSAAFEIAKRRRARRFIGFLFAAACSLFMFSLVSVFDNRLLASVHSDRPTLWTVAGGIVFAVGAFLNGRCSLGTIARLGSGDFSRLATLAGMFAGIWLGVATLPVMMMAKADALPLLTSVPPPLRIVIALLNLGLFAWLMRRCVPADFNTTQWPLWQSMTIIGTLSGVLVWLARDWSYTSLFRHFVRGDYGIWSFGMICFGALIGGAVTGAVISGGWQIRIGSCREWALAGGGGLLMGIGIILIPGGNDTMLLIGLPLLLPHLIAGYAVMYATLIGLALISQNRIMPLPPSSL